MNAITTIGTNLVVDFGNADKARSAMDWLDSHKPIAGRFIDDDGAEWPTTICAACGPLTAYPCVVVRFGEPRP